MMNRQRLGLLLMTSALIGSFGLPLKASELPLPPVGTVVPAVHTSGKPAQSTPRADRSARTAAMVRTASFRHRIHRVTAIALSPPPIQPVQPTRTIAQPALVEIASTAPQPSLTCRLWCSGPLVLGVTY